MKHFAYLYKIIGITAVMLLFIPQTAFADSSTSVDISNNGANSQNDVHVESNTGGNTICQNGKCTTTSGNNGHATVCINGQCQTSDNGNIDMQSDNGDDQVHISNNISGTPVSVSPSIVSPAPEDTDSPEPSESPEPTGTEMHEHIHQQVKAQIQNLKEHMKSQDAALSSLFQSLENFLNGLFK